MVAPISIAIDGTSNKVYVLDQSADTVTRYSPDGKIQKVFGSQAWRLANSMFPRLLRSTPGQPLYVADWGNHRIQKFSPDVRRWAIWHHGSGAGQIPCPLGLLSIATGICISRIRQLADDQARSRRNFSDSTHPVEHPASAVSWTAATRSILRPHKRGGGGQGNLYVADSGNNRIEKRRLLSSRESIRCRHNRPGR